MTSFSRNGRAASAAVSFRIANSIVPPAWMTLKAPPIVAVFHSFYAIHTGEAAGLAGRLLLFAATLGGLAVYMRGKCS